MFELPQLFQIQSGSPKPMNFQSVGEPDYFIPTLGQSVSELIIIPSDRDRNLVRVNQSDITLTRSQGAPHIEDLN